MINMDILRAKVLKDLRNLSKDEELIEILQEVDDGESLNCKIPQNSEKLREKGNKLLTSIKLDNNKQLHKVLCLYNESIARAPIGSEEIAKTYANKSALLLDMRRYNESISEADKALKITELIFLKVKLLCRKAECYTALGSSENRACLEKARFVFNKSEDPPKIKEMLMKFIEDAQLIVSKEKLDTPKENKRMTEVSKIIALEEKKDVWKSVEMKHTKKYGWHIVAARDFKPGEIILVEKPYMYHLKESRAYQYCYKCFNYLWTVVPCDDCCWRMFCSEECKNEAWKEYHDMECSVMSRMKLTFCCQYNEVISTILAIFYKALKEAGSIDQLLADFKSSISEDRCDKNLDYKTILASTTHDVREESTYLYTGSAATTLIGLAKFTKIFGKTYEFNEIGKLMRDDKAILVGCLLLKFSAVIVSRCSNVKLLDSTLKDGSLEEKSRDAGEPENPECRHPVFNIMTMLLLEGCIPNVETCRTIGHKSAMFALQPIKAGMPLISFNLSASVYDKCPPKHKRQLLHKQLYKCSCDCRACSENWPDDLNEAQESLRSPGVNIQALKRFLDEHNSITKEWHTNMAAHKPSYPDSKLISRVNNCAREGWKYFPIPSMCMKMCTLMLVCITRSFHNPDKNIFTTS